VFDSAADADARPSSARVPHVGEERPILLIENPTMNPTRNPTGPGQGTRETETIGSTDRLGSGGARVTLGVASLWAAFVDQDAEALPIGVAAVDRFNDVQGRLGVDGDRSFGARGVHTYVCR
jgi:hypothetical protein